MNWQEGWKTGFRKASYDPNTGTVQSGHFCQSCCHWKNASTVLGSSFLQREGALRCWAAKNGDRPLLRSVQSPSNPDQRNPLIVQFNTMRGHNFREGISGLFSGHMFLSKALGRRNGQWSLWEDSSQTSPNPGHPPNSVIILLSSTWLNSSQ